MDPKTLQPIDPKLKETYERVMGTSLTPPPSAGQNPPPPPPPVQPTPPIESKPPIQPQPQPKLYPPLQSNNNETPPLQQPSPQSTPLQHTEKEAVTPPPNTPLTTPVVSEVKNNPTETTTERKRRVPRVFLVLGGVVFLIAYAFFWLKFFNLSIPFLP